MIETCYFVDVLKVEVKGNIPFPDKKKNIHPLIEGVFPTFGKIWNLKTRHRKVGWNSKLNSCKISLEILSCKKSRIS